MSLTAWSALVALLGVAGCATYHDSDQPWNTPQPWEGSVQLPGMPTE